MKIIKNYLPKYKKLSEISLPGMFEFQEQIHIKSDYKLDNDYFCINMETGDLEEISSDELVLLVEGEIKVYPANNEENDTNI